MSFPYIQLLSGLNCLVQLKVKNSQRACSPEKGATPWDLYTFFYIFWYLFMSEHEQSSFFAAMSAQQNPVLAISYNVIIKDT